MKIMRMLRTKDSFHALPAQEQAEVMKKALDFVGKRTEAGKLGEIYFTPELNLVVVMWDMESPEEMAQVSMGYPLRPYSDYESYSLVDYDVSGKLSGQPQSTWAETSHQAVAQSS